MASSKSSKATRRKTAAAAGSAPRLARESDEDRKARLRSILRVLKRTYPAPECALDHESPLQLLVATILSAQCTDERVNKTTPALFAAYPDATSFATADRSHLEELVRSTGFYRNKAKNIQEASRQIVSRHGGEVPRTMEELLELPGVARKTANVVLGVAFGKAVGIVVDTHVGRISRLLALTAETDPVKVERDLMSIVPKAQWIDFSHRLILHGRAICIARRPQCEECPIRASCPSARVV